MKKLLTKTFLIRTISGVLLVAIILFTTIMGNDLCFLTILAASLVGLAELYKVVGINTKKIGLMGYIATVIYFIFLRIFGGEYMAEFIIFYFLVIMGAYVMSFPNYRTEQILMGFSGVIYVSVLMSHIYMVRMSEYGLYTVWLIFICAWGCDTCAYLAGVTCGKHKMAPVLSPKKSIEGAVGGVVGAAVIGAGYGYFIKDKISGIDSVALVFAMMCAIGALISMIGDLAASAVKRNYDIKDYGKLIPGHGGILDRFDSILFTAPIVYYLLFFFGEKFLVP